MRILQVANLPASPPGGASRFISESGLALGRLGHDVEFLFRPELFSRLAGGGTVRTRLLGPWLVALAVWRRVSGGRRYDVVQIREPDAAAYCLVRRLGLGSLPPCAVLSLGTDERGWRAQQGRWRALGIRASRKSRISVPLTIVGKSRYAFRNAEQVLVSNDADRDYLVLDLGVPARRVSQVNTGVDDSFFSIPRGTRRPTRRILFVGTWTDRKGTLELVQAWQEVAQRRDLSLAVVGALTPEATVRDAFRADLRERIAVLPVVDDQGLRNELARADAFVLPSWFEGMPLATLEAAAAGLPCVVSAIPGHREIFRGPDPEADGALLVPPHDAAALAGALERLAVDGELAQRLGRKARQRARAFTWARTAEQLEAAYLGALEER